MQQNSKLRNSSILILSCIVSFGMSQSNREIVHYRNNGIQLLINGIQEGDFSPGTYLIPHDIMVEKGKTLTIFPGTTILLIQSAMMVVNGRLICSGTAESPVVFRRLANELYPEPLDSRLDTRWDGIYLPDSAILEMKNTIISDSKYGVVVSGKDVSMRLDSVRFYNNKFQNVKIGERMLKIAPNAPVRYKYPEQEGVYIPPAVIVNATETIQQKKHLPHQTDYPTLRVAMGITGGVGLITAVTGFVAYNKYNGISPGNRTDSDVKSLKLSSLGVATGATMFGIGAAGFIWTFFY